MVRQLRKRTRSVSRVRSERASSSAPVYKKVWTMGRRPLTEANFVFAGESEAPVTNPVLIVPSIEGLDLLSEVGENHWDLEDADDDPGLAEDIQYRKTSRFGRGRTVDLAEIPSGYQSLPEPTTDHHWLKKLKKALRNGEISTNIDAQLTYLQTNPQFRRDMLASQASSAGEQEDVGRQILFRPNNFAGVEKVTEILVGTRSGKLRYISEHLQGFRQRRTKSLRVSCYYEAAQPPMQIEATSEVCHSIRQWRKGKTKCPAELPVNSDPLEVVLNELDPRDSYYPSSERHHNIDIAHGKEAHKILKFDRDDIPYESKSFKYIRKNEVHKMRNAEEKELLSCGCEGDCGTDCNCVRNSLIAGGAFIMGDQIVVSDNLDFWKSLVIACGAVCACRGKCSNDPDNILNAKKLQLFKKCERVGWGVRTAELIKPGEIICEFRGEVITDEEQQKRPESSAWTWLIYAKKHVQDKIDQSYILLRNNNPEKCTIPEGQLVIDPRMKGNIARYVNHSELANATPIRLFVNDCRPEKARLLFIATRHIAPKAEVFFDYGDQYESLAGQSCLCDNLLCGDQKSARRFAWSGREFKRALDYADVSIQMRHLDTRFQKRHEKVPYKDLKNKDLTLISKKIALLEKRSAYISLDKARVQDFANFIQRDFKPRAKKIKNLQNGQTEE